GITLSSFKQPNAPARCEINLIKPVVFAGVVMRHDDCRSVVRRPHQVSRLRNESGNFAASYAREFVCLVLVGRSLPKSATINEVDPLIGTPQSRRRLGANA